MKSMLCITITFLLSTISAQNVCYVKPDHPSVHCPGQPCLTLDQYTEEKTYFTTGATFVFLAGNHTVENTVELVNVDNITFRGEKNRSDVYIICRNEMTILCEKVSTLTVKGLTFILQYQCTTQSSSALKLYESQEVHIMHTTFQGNADRSSGLTRALLLFRSDIKIVSCLFEGNTGDNGGAIHASGSNITLSGNTFTQNRATINGGAIFANETSITLDEVNGNRFVYNSADIRGGALILLYCFINSAAVNFSDNEESTINMYFSENKAQYGGAILIYDSVASLSGTIVFTGNLARYYGGAIYAKLSAITVNAKFLKFAGNKADGDFTKKGNSNSLLDSLAILEEATDYCCTEGENTRSFGGAISMMNSALFLSDRVLFNFNQAQQGGAIFLSNTSAVFNGNNIRFINNSAYAGGAINSHDSQVSLAKMLQFINNTAVSLGGSIWSFGDMILEVTFANFISNSAGLCGGAMFVQLGIVALTNINVTENSGSAVCLVRSNGSISGMTQILKNSGEHGGGIRSINSVLSFAGYTLLDGNEAVHGGAVYVFYSQAYFSGITLFINNKASMDGGGLHAVGTDTTLKNTVEFTSNLAQNGGAMYLQSAATLTLEQGTNLTTSFNKAACYGGAMYHEDSITQLQCQFELTTEEALQKVIFFLPACFLTMKEMSINNTMNFSITLYHDSANIAGNFLYGGLIDKCQINMLGYKKELRWIILYAIYQYYNIFHLEPIDFVASEIASQPYKLCFCESIWVYNCSSTKSIQVYRGQTFSVSLLALAQGETITSTNIMARNSPTARLQLDRVSQFLEKNCTKLLYKIFSSENHAELILYPDAPCRDTGLAKASINVTLLPCPDAFILQAEQCICEERLQIYNAECVTGKPSYIVKKAGMEVWMKPLYETSYEGMILYKTCPLGYCTNDTINITFDNFDVQCALHRSGILCGSCVTNYSLMLGSSQCQVCSNTYLALLIPFAAAGIALVVFLTILRLTVVTGMINSLILYANIVQANKTLFYPSQVRNVLTVFIAWMNLDLGLQTCFYDGMDAYAQTWLQFAFPLYIWILISLIILTSRYSMTISKLIGSNPVAVLATLLLMSYTKILKIIIEVYSSVDLDYPDNKTVTVWLKDANVPYLQSKHLLLTVITSIILVFFVLPYTILLLLGYKLYRFSESRYFQWLNRIKMLLDSYYAPYNIHTRYWTGLLLFVRCALYIVFSFNSIGATAKSLLAIALTFTAMGIASGHLASGRLYSNLCTNVIEASIYLNLVILSTATLAEVNSSALVYTLIGLVFLTTIGIILYHFHLSYIAQSAIWLKLQAKFFTRTEEANRTVYTPLLGACNSSSHNQHTIVTKTVIGLREPLLDD